MNSPAHSCFETHFRVLLCVSSYGKQLSNVILSSVTLWIAGHADHLWIEPAFCGRLMQSKMLSAYRCCPVDHRPLAHRCFWTRNPTLPPKLPHRDHNPHPSAGLSSVDNPPRSTCFALNRGTVSCAEFFFRESHWQWHDPSRVNLLHILLFPITAGRVILFAAIAVP